MHWVAPTEKDVINDTLEKRLWAILQTQNLRRTRDLLLPRLVSGQVELNPKSA
jgi:hypothetical protein